MRLTIDLIIGFVLGAIVVSPVAYYYGKQEQKRIMISEVATETLNKLKERGKTNAEIQNLDARNLCIFIGGLPEDC